MKHSRKYPKTRDVNKHNNSMGTPENRMSTSFLSTSDDRITIKIPKNSRLYEYLYVDMEGDPRAKWVLLDQLITIYEKSRTEAAEWVFEDFETRMRLIYPEKYAKICKLRPQVLRRILKGEKLLDSYYEDLKD